MAKKRSQKRIKDKKLGTFKFIYAPKEGRTDGKYGDDWNLFQPTFKEFFF